MGCVRLSSTRLKPWLDDVFSIFSPGRANAFSTLSLASDVVVPIETRPNVS